MPGIQFRAQPSQVRWPHTFWSGSCFLRAAKEEAVVGAERERALVAARCPAHGHRVREIKGRQLMLDLRLTVKSGHSGHMPPIWIRSLHCIAIMCTGSEARLPGFESWLCCISAVGFCVPEFSHL